ncbi:MAG: 5'-nucleotidase, partial [Kiritimatiellia bacterium]|nr:5'-nucleotidase [Kiritimatiellia bacterium]
PVHPVLAERFGPILARTEREMKKKIGTAAVAMGTADETPGGGAIGRLLRESIRKATGADLVLHGALTSESLEKGEITEKELWRIVPFENRLGVASLTWGEVRLLLEENLERGERRVMGVSGARALLDPQAAAGSRIVSLTLPDGTTPHPRRRFRVAINSYALASAGGRFPELRRLTGRPEARLTLLDLQTRDAVREAIRSMSPLDFSDRPSDGFHLRPPQR